MKKELADIQLRATRLLERWADAVEPDWQSFDDDPALGCYGPGYPHWGVQSNWNYAAALATLAAKTATANRERCQQRAISALRYLLATHVTGHRPGTNGRRWGNDWISMLGIERAMHGLAHLDSELSPADRDALRRVLISEADWLLLTPSRGQHAGVCGGLWAHEGRNRPESNIWSGGLLWRVAHLFPDEAHAAAWREEAHGAIMHRSANRLASFAWRAHGLAQGLCVPPGDGSMAEWPLNLCPVVRFIGDDEAQPGKHRRLLGHQLASLGGGDSLLINRSATRRGGRYRSLFVEEVCMHVGRELTRCRPGAVLADIGFAVLSGVTAERTARVCGGAIPFAQEGLRGAWVDGANGNRSALVANFGAAEREAEVFGETIRLAAGAAAVHGPRGVHGSDGKDETIQSLSKNQPEP